MTMDKKCITLSVWRTPVLYTTYCCSHWECSLVSSECSMACRRSSKTWKPVGPLMREPLLSTKSRTYKVPLEQGYSVLKYVVCTGTGMTRLSQIVQPVAD